jgi:hypothetical protein
VTVPFELGTYFQVSAFAPMTPTEFEINFPGQSFYAYNNVNVSFQLFEADGVTPVPLFLAPQPSTFGLLLCGTLASFGFTVTRRLRKTHAKHCLRVLS